MTVFLLGDIHFSMPTKMTGMTTIILSKLIPYCNVLSVNFFLSFSKYQHFLWAFIQHANIKTVMIKATAIQIEAKIFLFRIEN